MLTGGREAADEVTRNRAGTYAGLVNTTSSADALFAAPSRPIGVATLPERVLVAVPPTDRTPRGDEAAPPDRAGGLRRNPLALAGIDFAAAAIAAVVAHCLHVGAAPSLSVAYEPAVVALPVAWLILVGLNGGFGEPATRSGREEFTRIARAFVHFAVLVAVTSYAAHADLARGFVLLALPLALSLDVGGRFAARRWQRRRSADRQDVRPVLAVGDVSAVCDFADAVLRDRTAGITVRGACLTGNHPDDADLLAAMGVPNVGDLDTVVDSARAIGAATIAVVSASQVGSDRLRWIAWRLEGTGIDLLVSPGLVEVAPRRLRVRSVAWMPLLSVEQPEFRGFRRLAKEVLDRLSAFVAVVLLLPLLAVIYVVVRLSSPGPAIFRQTRVGRDGKAFQMLKFRSMFVDAEARLADLKGRNVHPSGPLFKLHDDPRVTRIGRVLRRYSLDELPQLVNVLTGHMSLVGPRPPLPSEVEEYETDARRRLLVKPGITGLWQVSGRSDLSWAESVRLDLRYVENWSPALDLMILWKTASAVLRGSGAY
jgi:exopolysaccharide biosynthesis polyprenyl glycosylphosphotransferase